MAADFLKEDNSYLECGLPEYVKHSIRQLEEGRRKVNSGERYLQLDMDWSELNADIGIAESEQEITPRQARYLRKKYLGME